MHEGILKTPTPSDCLSNRFLHRITNILQLHHTRHGLESQILETLPWAIGCTWSALGHRSQVTHREHLTGMHKTSESSGRKVAENA